MNVTGSLPEHALVQCVTQRTWQHGFNHRLERHRRLPHSVASGLSYQRSELALEIFRLVS